MTLTEAAKNFRLALKFGWLIIFLPLVVRIILGIIDTSGPNGGNGTTPPTFNAAFGRLPALVIENTEIPPSSPSHILDLVNSTFPDAVPIMNVYPIISAPYGFLSRDKAAELAKELNFDEEPTTVDSTSLKWQEGLRALTVDATNLHFTYTFNYTADPTVFSLNAFASEQFALNTAEGILKDLDILEGSLGENLDPDTPTVSQLRFDGGRLIKSTTLFNTSAIKVDHFVLPFEGVNVVNPHYYEGLVNLTISSKRDQPEQNYFPRILELNYVYWKFDKERKATYPLITPNAAYQLFQQNFSRYLVFLGDPNNLLTSFEDKIINVLITRETDFGYYNPDNYQQYLQPVWIFRGKATLETGQQVDFVAYVPAITREWVQ